ncbi:MAG: peptide chain release factor N(5)-glutamine methyltransferase [Armatimonadetes bacterium]|nr:peptide chain release factor N(5)-glutamine methyltransferase [Armatimonadota bacterium]
MAVYQSQNPSNYRMDGQHTLDDRGGRLEALLFEIEQQLAAVGIENPHLEAQLLLALAASARRLDVLRRALPDLSQEQLLMLESLVSRREQREPLAYLRGYQEFYGIKFKVTSAVLIPRPETEMLVDIALQKTSPRSNARIADIGTGSGCIAISIARHRYSLQVTATDLSIDALRIARHNANNILGARSIRLLQTDLLSGFAAGSLDGIVANMPYVSVGEKQRLQPEILNYEPDTALYAGADGLSHIRKLIDQAAGVLKPGGWIALEVGCGQSDSVAGMLEDRGFSAIFRERDLAGIERCVSGNKPS